MKPSYTANADGNTDQLYKTVAGLPLITLPVNIEGLWLL